MSTGPVKCMQDATKGNQHRSWVWVGVWTTCNNIIHYSSICKNIDLQYVQHDMPFDIHMVAHVHAHHVCYCSLLASRSWEQFHLILLGYLYCSDYWSVSCMLGALMLYFMGGQTHARGFLATILGKCNQPQIWPYNCHWHCPTCVCGSWVPKVLRTSGCQLYMSHEFRDRVEQAPSCCGNVWSIIWVFMDGIGVDRPFWKRSARIIHNGWG